MIKQILTYPDKQLTQVSKPVEDLNSEEFKQLILDMEHTIKANNAQGLAAIQIGVPLRVFCTLIDVEFEDARSPELRFFVNPRLDPEYSEGQASIKEGCLSFPGVMEYCKRFEEVRVYAQDKTGEDFILDLDGLESVAVQHELDHLDGILFVDRVGKLKRKMMLKSLAKQRKKYGR